MEISEEKLTSRENVTFITRYYKQDHFTSPRHYHMEYEIAYIEQSEGKLYVGNNIVDFKPGSLFIFAPKLVHCFKNIKNQTNKKKKAKATIILFKKEFLGVSFLERKETVLLNKLLANSEAGIQIFNPSKELVALIKQLSFNQGLKSILDLLSILDYLSKSTEHKLLSTKWVKKYYYRLNDGLINKLFKHIEVNFASELVFKEALEMSGMGTTSFSRYFKNKTEKTFTQYVNEIRIANAQKLLINSDLKISYICFKCGFNNLTYFNRIFKKLNNITPREFRNLYLMAD
jgi:AraC-like DNA-binding protein